MTRFTVRILLTLFISICLPVMCGCYEPHFSKESADDNVVRFVEVYVTYSDEPEYHGETYSFGYSEDNRLLAVSYLNQQSQDSKWEDMAIAKDENGNPIGFEGEISGDNQFAQYMLSIFTQDYMHQLENNDMPLDIDITRLQFAQKNPIRLQCEYAFQTQKEDIPEIRLYTLYDPDTLKPEYHKTVVRIQDQKTVREIYTWISSAWQYERSE